jgi:hypothetical protein
MRKLEINKLRTTKLGEERVRRNLRLDVDDVVAWCIRAACNADADSIIRKGKNWYVRGDDCVLTINVNSHTIITAHKTQKI